MNKRDCLIQVVTCEIFLSHSTLVRSKFKTTSVCPVSTVVVHSLIDFTHNLISSTVCYFSHR